MALAFASLSESAKCFKVTDISLFPKRLMDVTLTPLTMLMPTEPYIDDAFNMLFVKLKGLKFIPAAPPLALLILLESIIGCANVV
jgi:hypothetical protein